MANRCCNKLTLVGPADSVGDFIHRAIEAEPPVSSLSFHKFVPLKEDSNKGERKAWGVKWGAYNDSLIEDQLISSTARRATYKFDTAWKPPGLFLHKVSKQYPSVLFLLSYDEDSPYRGRWIIKDGTTDKLIEGEKSPDFGEPESPDFIEDEEDRHDAWEKWGSVYYDSHDQWVGDAAFVGTLQSALRE